MTARSKPRSPGVFRVPACALTRGTQVWPYETANAAAIRSHWERRQRENPAFFNGTVFVLREHELSAAGFTGTCAPVPFASFLHWREHGYPETGVRDCFGSAIVCSAEGHVLLGRQGAGQLNTGLAYFPGGFLDPRDCRPDGSIDIDGSIVRELAEETGLDASHLRREPGFLITVFQAHVSIGVVFRSSEAAAPLAERMREGLARDRDRELTEIVIVRDRATAEATAMPGFARQTVDALLG